MYQRILVPLDGSRRAERAIPLASRLAKASGGSLVFVRVVSPPVEFGKYARQHSVAWEKAIYETQRAQAASYLAGMVLVHAADLVGIEVEIEVATGITAQTLVVAAQKERADLLIMCGRRKTRLSGRFFGSLTQEVGRQIPVPVLALRENGTMPRGASLTPPLRILVALDGSPLAEAAFAPALRLASALNASGGGGVHLLRVLHPFPAGEKRRGKRNGEHALQEAERYLEEVAEHLRGTYPGAGALTITTSIMTGADVAGAIAATGQENACDLVVLTRSGRTGLPSLLNPSIAERVLDATCLPLLMVQSSAVMDGCAAGLHRRIRWA